MKYSCKKGKPKCSSIPQFNQLKIPLEKHQNLRDRPFVSANLIFCTNDLKVSGPLK